MTSVSGIWFLSEVMIISHHAIFSLPESLLSAALVYLLFHSTLLILV